jgi:hypothetical protein
MRRLLFPGSSTVDDPSDEFTAVAIPNISGRTEGEVEITRQFVGTLEFVNLITELDSGHAMVLLQTAERVLLVAGQIAQCVIRQIRHVGAACVVHQHSAVPGIVGVQVSDGEIVGGQILRTDADIQDGDPSSVGSQDLVTRAKGDRINPFTAGVSKILCIRIWLVDA